MKLTVFFDGQFWVGVVEQQDDAGYKVARHLFGAEPTDTEVFAFVQQAIPSILDAVPVLSASEAAVSAPAKINPKRRKREAAAEVRARGVSTYAQEMLKRDLEARQRDRQHATRQQQEEERDYKWLSKVQKAREKHRGH
jgi:hypothetical protein